MKKAMMKTGITVLMLLMLAALLCACATEKKKEAKQAEATAVIVPTATLNVPAEAVYRILVLDQNGRGIQGVQLSICDALCYRRATDENGVITMPMDASYSVHVLSADGYYADANAEYSLTPSAPELVITLQAR